MINELCDDINELLINSNSILKITDLNDFANILDLIKSDEKLCSDFDEMLFDNFKKFISIKYTLNDKIYYYIPYDLFNSLETCNFSTTDLYEFIKLDQYKSNYHIEENMEEDELPETNPNL